MSSNLLKVAALFGVAAYACDGPSYQLHKRADSAIGTSGHSYTKSTLANTTRRMVLRRKSRLGNAIARLRALPSRNPTSPHPLEPPTRSLNSPHPHPQLHGLGRRAILQLGLRPSLRTRQSALHLRVHGDRLPGRPECAQLHLRRQRRQ